MMRKLLLFSLVMLMQVGCIRHYDDLVVPGDTQQSQDVTDAVTGDHKVEVSPSDVPGRGETDLKDTTDLEVADDTVEPPADTPKDTSEDTPADIPNDIVSPSDTLDTEDVCVPDCDGKECADDGCGGSCGDCPADYPNCVGGQCLCTPFSCISGTYCTGGQCVPCTVDAHCGPDCVSCPSMGQFCGPDGVTCLDCDDGHPCPSSQSCIDNACTPCEDLGFCGPDCLTCEGETPDCVGGDCVCNDSSCPEEHACDGGDCVPCTDSDPAYCGPDCLTCTGGTPHCLDGACTLCDTEAACGPSCEVCEAQEHCVPDQGCVPDCTAEGCTSDLGPNGEECNKAKIIGRLAAAPGAGPFLTSGDTTNAGDDDNLPSFGTDCWDAQEDEFYRIWLNAGDQIAISADPTDADFQLSLKLYQGTVCGDIDHLIQCHWDEDDGEAETILHTATSDDWVTIVVDGASGFSDQGDWGTYDLSVTLICITEGCCAGCGECDPNLEECTETTTGGTVCAAKMVDIPAGIFWMGCNNCTDSAVSDSECYAREHPYHEVYLDTYEMDRTEVTAGQYHACVSAGECDPAGTGSYVTYDVSGKEDHPINYVDWTQADAYCQWAGKNLCTEAQWEKGARGGCEHNGGASNCKAQSRKYPWGHETLTCDLVVKSGCDGDTQPVCSKSPAGDSPYGLCDMAGNVREWTADWYGSDYYCAGSGADTSAPWTYCTECGSWPGSPAAWSNPFCTIIGSGRVFRGGGFVNGDYGLLRVASRNGAAPSDGDHYLGFRCCRTDCGDGLCNEAVGEDCSNCIQDCGCPEGDTCFDGECVQVTEGFVPIEAGSFWMGSPGGEQCPVGYTGGGCDGSGAGTTVAEPGRSVSEALHEVVLTVDFEMLVTEVTQGEWKLMFGDWNPSGSTIGDTNPVETVSWFDSLAYANWKSAQEGYAPCYVFTGVECVQGGNPSDGSDTLFCLNATHGGINAATVTLAGGGSKPQECEGYRLPTEAEWEHAGRAGAVSAYYDGQESDSGHPQCEVPFHLTEMAWYCGNNSPNGTKAVGGKAANAWGLKDMIGNVYEWCWDPFCVDATGYGDDPDGSSCVNSPRVRRGGYWNSDEQNCRSANRNSGSPGTRSDVLGFRLARSL